MLSCFDFLRDINALSVGIRLFLAMLCGGAVGLERSYRRRPVGFRTHILICLGAAMTTMTSQYLLLVPRLYNDISRMGAQVVAGVGFIGAGTIIVTRRQRVKGLTTAAGLWGVAIIGLTLGGGFYEGGLLATGMILVAELVFAKWEYRLLDSAPEINLYMEYRGRVCLETVLKFYREFNLKLLNMEITRHADSDSSTSCAIFTLRLNKKCSAEWVVAQLHGVKGINIVEEM